MSHDPDAARRLARTIDESRLELGLSKHDLARIARVARPTVSRLINHAEIPARASTLGRIEKALGWESLSRSPGRAIPNQLVVSERKHQLISCDNHQYKFIVAQMYSLAGQGSAVTTRVFAPVSTWGVSFCGILVALVAGVGGGALSSPSRT